MRFVMQMAAPEQESERVTFRWTTDRNFGSADPTGQPYHWDDVALSVEEHPDVQIDCIVEFKGQAGTTTTMGTFSNASVVLTVLDEDVSSIQGASRVLVSGTEYNIMYVAPAQGLFEVTLYQVFCQTPDES
jgi:hypothetical protein